MVSTLQPPPRRHKKKKKDPLSGRNTQDLLKNGLSSAHPHSKKRKEQPSTTKTEIAAAYEEDLGVAGIKKAKTCTIARPNISSATEGQKLQISETAEEKLRRLRRKV